MASKIELRKVNRNLIYRCIYGSEGIARGEVAAKTGLSIPTVIQNLTELESRGLITTDGEFESTGGRRAKVLRCVYDIAFGVGIEITRNHLTIVLIDLCGRVCAGGEREYFPYEHSDAYYDAVCGRLEAMLEEKKIDRQKILGVGISLPSIVDRSGSRVMYGTILGEPADIVEYFTARLPWPIRIMNDANAAGMAETWNTVSDGGRFYLMLSNSVGGAITINGRIYQGDNCRSAEIGHVKIVPGGKRCYCGQQGCANGYVSACILSDMTEGNLEAFFENVRAEEEPFASSFDAYLNHLAMVVVNLRMLFDCVIILGGYVGNYMESYMDRLGEKLSLLNPYEKGIAYVQPCRQKTCASAVGAALPYISQFIEQI